MLKTRTNKYANQPDLTPRRKRMNMGLLYCTLNYCTADNISTYRRERVWERIEGAKRTREDFARRVLE